MSELALVFYKTIKHNSNCLICGSSYNIQFHHCEPEQKISEIFKIAKGGDLRATIEEMQKCVPVCDPDHRAIHRGLRRGWLKGEFDNGRPSHAIEALPYMPYLNWLSKRKPQVFVDFYRQNIEAAHNVVWPFLSDINHNPRLRLVK